MRENGIRIRLRRLSDVDAASKKAAMRAQSWIFTHASLSEQMQIIEGRVEYQVASAERVLAHAVEHGRVEADTDEGKWTVEKALDAFHPLILHVCHTNSEPCQAMRLALESGATTALERGVAGAECVFVDIVPADAEADQGELDLKAAKSYA